VSDVDIDLRNAQESLLQQRKEVTVRILSLALSGIYGDELIAGWLSANPPGGPDEH
jgi:hypothetical protein